MRFIASEVKLYMSGFKEGSVFSQSDGQVLPMVGNFMFVRPELLPGFLIKLNDKN